MQQTRKRKAGWPEKKRQSACEFLQSFESYGFLFLGIEIVSKKFPPVSSIGIFSFMFENSLPNEKEKPHFYGSIK